MPDEESQEDPEPEPYPVQCKFCAYLAFFEGDPLRITRNEVPPTIRIHGIEALPHCMVGSYRLEQESRDDGTDRLLERFQKVVERFRDCKEHADYEPGETPQEAHQRWRAMQLEVQRRQWEADMEKERRDFNKDMAERNEAFLKHLHDDNKAADGRQQKRDAKITMYFLILAGLEVIGTIAAITIALIDLFSGDVNIVVR